MSETSPPAGSGNPPPGGKPKKKNTIGGVPMWAAALGGGLAIGIVYIIWKGKKSKDTTGQGTPQAGGPAYGSPSGATIVPVNGGITDDQLDQITNSILSLQGEPSRPHHHPDMPPQSPEHHKKHKHGGDCDETDDDNCPWSDDDSGDHGDGHGGDHGDQGDHGGQGGGPHGDHAGRGGGGDSGGDSGGGSRGWGHRGGWSEDQGQTSGGRHHAEGQ